MTVGDSRKEYGIRNWLWQELVLTARFGIVGIAATAVHILIVWQLLSVTSLPALAANTFAFLAALCISFAGNYLWTFRSPGHPGKAMRRFLLIAGSAFAGNTLLLASLLRAGWLSPTASAIVSASMVPAVTFWASRVWGFKHHKSNCANPDSLGNELSQAKGK